MAEPTSNLSFAELIRKVANKAGVAYFGYSGDQSALVPVDTYNLGVCKDIVRDAFRMFVADGPKRGWHWQKRIMSVTLTATRITGTADDADSTSLTDATLEDTYDGDDDLNDYYIYIDSGTGIGSFAQITDYTASGGVITVDDWLDQYGNAGGTNPAADSTYVITPVETVAGDIARYPLPEYFGGEVNGKIEYTANTAHATPIQWVDESFIRANRSITVSTGYPRYAAIRPLEPAITDIENGSAKRRFELILSPQPSAADTLEFPYLASFDNLDLETGVATGGAATTLTDTARIGLEADDYFLGWRCDIIDGTGKGSWAIVTGYVSATGVITVADWLTIAGAAGGVNPAANSAYTLQPVNNFHPAGFRFDEYILAACYAKLAMEDEEIDPALEQRYIQKALPKAYEMDARLAPKTLGSMNGFEKGYRRTWSNVTTDNDV